jgi:cell division protein FtsI (penicillin-binding protein 3)
LEKQKDILLRVYLLYAVMLIFASAIIFQIFKIQITEGELWKQKAQTLTTTYKTIEAVRGNIYAADGSLLATSLPIYEIRMDAAIESISKEMFDKNIDSLSICLSNLFNDKSAYEYKRMIIKARKNKNHYLLLKKNVRYTELKKLKTFPLFRNGRYKGGLIYIQHNKREMPFKNIAVRTIGYYRNGIKPVGLEGAYNDKLTGKPGKQLMQRISGNDWMPLDDEAEIEPENGADIITTIDVNIQDVAQAALYKQLVKSKAHHGCVILMETATGEIKAIANLTRKDSLTYVEDYNYAIGEATYPGSTFKLASYLAALDDGYISINDSVDIEVGQKAFADRIVKDSHPKENRLSIKRAFEVSSNVAIAKIITKYYSKNPSRFIDKLHQFGLDKPLAIELPGEAKPRIKKPGEKDWYSTTLPWLAHGYECQITPLQLLTFYNAVANNGIIVKPLFVKEIVRDGKTIKKNLPVIEKTPIASAQAIELVKKMLEGVVENGTAKNLKTNYLKIAGKTGTAVLSGFAKNVNDHDNSNKRYQASFFGYFPANDPKYSLCVVINNPAHDVGYYANVVAGPVFKEIADKVYSTNLKLHKKLSTDTSSTIEFNPLVKGGYVNDAKDFCNYLQLPCKNITVSGWVKTNNNNALEKTSINTPMPEVVGMCLQDAVYLLESKGYYVEIKGKGLVKKQTLINKPNGVKKITLELSS